MAMISVVLNVDVQQRINDFARYLLTQPVENASSEQQIEIWGMILQQTLERLCREQNQSVASLVDGA